MYYSEKGPEERPFVSIFLTSKRNPTNIHPLQINSQKILTLRKKYFLAKIFRFGKAKNKGTYFSAARF